ncbi:MAG: D-alanyl-D-alanine carboxypeptidase, partial [Clostridia bacterium]|nr:D-alanyl-D-alanine carboxypeptidase [Clostridia bacterium]
MKRLIQLAAFFTAFCLLLPMHAHAEPLENTCPLTLTAPSALLMEAHTGTVIFEKNAQEARPAASITKLMTLLLTFERLADQTITLQDPVTVSANAARQTGSQAFLDASSTYTVEQLLKATVISSANDAAVALAEHLAGTEESFVRQM